jgi:hypothetical protein
MFVAMSLIQEKIKPMVKLFVALGPAAKMYHCKSKFFKSLSPVAGVAADALNSVGIYDMFPSSKIQDKVLSTLCTYAHSLCNFAINMLADQNPTYDNPERFDVFMGHFPSGASTKNLLEYAQLINSENF